MFTPSTPLETIAVCVQFVRHQSVKMRDDANLDVVYLIDSRFRRNVERTVSYISFLLGLGYLVNRSLKLVITDANEFLALAKPAVLNLWVFAYPQIENYQYNLAFCVPLGQLEVENRWNKLIHWPGLPSHFLFYFSSFCGWQSCF